MKLRFDYPYLSTLRQKISQIPFRHEIGLFIVCAIFLGFCLHHLGCFISVDEEKWLYVRVRQLYVALAHGNWAQTYINDKPGVLPSLLSGIVFNFTDIKHYNPLTAEHFLFLWRLPIVLFNLGMVLLIYKFLKDLFDKSTGLILTAVVATNPTLIGLSQIVNPDATLWSTGTVASLTFLLFLKTGRPRYVLWSSLFLSLALISKYSATYFFLSFYALLILAYLLGIVPKERFGPACLGWLAVSALSSFGYFALFPATWVNPALMWRGTLGCELIRPMLKPFAAVVIITALEPSVFKGYLVNRLRASINISRHLLGITGLFLFLLILYVLIRDFADGTFWGGLEKGYRGGASFLPSLQANTLVFLTTLDTVTVIGIFLFSIFGIMQWIRPASARQIPASFLYMLIIAVLGFCYIFGTSLAGFYAGSRYQMLTYPFYAMAAGLVFSALTKHRAWVFFGVVLISLFEIVEVSPFYFCYNNRLNTRDHLITDAWGFGGYEAAKWASARFDKDHTEIWIDREGFSQFSDNDVHRWNEKPWRINGLDYLVLTARGRIWANGARKGMASRWVYGPMLEYYDKPYEFELRIAGNPNNYVRIVPYDGSEGKQVLVMNATRSNNGLGYIDLRRSQSISFWIKAKVNTPGAPFLVDGSYNSALGIESRNDFSEGALRFRYASKGEGAVLDTGLIHDGNWHHVVWYQWGGDIGEEWGLYVDGKKHAIAKVPVRKQGTPVVRLNIFQGTMEDFEIFDHALTLSDVIEIYDMGRSERGIDNEESSIVE